jgi:hypothetical protein
VSKRVEGGVPWAPGAPLAVLGLLACTEPRNGTDTEDSASVESLPPTELPLTEVRVISDGPELDYQSTALELDDGSWLAVFERFSTTAFEGGLWSALSTDHRTFSGPEPLVLVDEPLVTGPVALGSWLYFMAGDAAQGRARLFRTPPDAAVVEPLDMEDDFAGMFAWPHPAALPGGRVALAYDHYQVDARIALGDGLTFGEPFVLGPGVLTRVAAAADGSLVATFQRGSGGRMTAFFRRSTDGVAWSEEAVVFDGSTNVHDAVPFRRLDGGVDIYYIAPGLQGFTVRRRQLGDTLGPEEQVTGDSLAPATEPHPIRLADGSILLTFTRERVNQVDYDATCAVFRGDAP